MERLSINEIIDHCDRQLKREPVWSIFYREHEAVKAYLTELLKYRETGLDPENMSHWEEFFKAECEGRLVILPCKVGQPYYTIAKICNEGGDVPDWTPHFGSDCEFCCVPCNARKEVVEHRFANVQQILGYSSSIGKTVFLTREEAEAALKGGNNES